ncbi:PREDICTED: uncharacterized protein LOC106746394 isoform X2 [Dinoponera quadriceps]|uniref:Uncharacterized protein LOC106746394 isoform X2 n=1 Tax=Dinoponera quadriceps TaxID=609295 RepID=A0A6P3XJQ0_DINQU|nr:PREDICTED: uncharacterized protein LOC106746394 isoform X2 [Dinoponera quadriceps]
MLRMDRLACSCRAVEIDIGRIVAAVAALNDKICRLREEIDAFKSEKGDDLVRDCSRPAEFNDSTKNAGRRTNARCEPQRNFKGDDDSPAGTDLSARLSFAERAREVKAACREADVFKEGYGDKSIGNEERPDSSRTSISDVGASENVRDHGDDRASHDNGEKSRKPGRCRDTLASDVPKIRRKRISRGVQYDVPVRRERSAGSLFLSCFRPRTRGKVEKARVSADESSSKRSCDSTEKGRGPTGDADLKQERFEGDGENIRSVVDGDGKRRENGGSEDRHSSRLGTPRKVSVTRDNDAKALGERSNRNSVVIGSSDNQEQIVETTFGDKRTSSDRERNDGSHGERSVKFSDHKAENARRGNADSDRRETANEARKRLDFCIAELNGIIRDACVIFGKSPECEVNR